MVAFSSILPNQLGHTLVSGDLQLRFVHVAGKGAYGIVYLAWDLSTPESSPKFLAVKCTLKYKAGTEYETLQKREIVYHSAMSGHPNVTTLHRVIEEEYYVYLVLDYHDGGDLFSAIIDRHTFEHNDAAVKLAYVQLLDAVQACHDAGISHRDLKPENIMCSHQDSRLFLTDFGLATETGISDSYGCGSGHYMSPECVGSFEEATPYSTRRSDIWALGIILINIVAGRHPWELASVAHDNGFSQYCKGPATFLSCILPISREAAVLLSRVLDPNPRTRMSIPELKQAVLDIRTFFPEEDVPDYIRLADESFRASLRQPDFDAEDPLDDHELIMDVPFDFPHTSSMSGFSSVPFHSPCASMFINQTPSTTSSLDTSETTPPVTPTSPAAELLNTVPHLALVAGGSHVDAMERGGVVIMAAAKSPPRKANRVHRFVGAMRRVALGA